MLWYWRNLEWPMWAFSEDEEPEVGEETECTWVELAIDFQAATACSLCGIREDCETWQMDKRGDLFADASRALARICDAELAPKRHHGQGANSLTPLRFPNQRGFKIRPHFLCHGVLTKVLFEAAVEAIGKKTGVTKLIPNFGNIEHGTPLRRKRGQDFEAKRQSKIMCAPRL